MKTVQLGEVARIDRDGVDPAALTPETTYVGLEHIQKGGVIDKYSTVGQAGVKSGKFRFTAGHVLFGKLRPNLVKIARPDVSGVCSTDILPVKPSERLNRDFLVHYLRQPTMVSYASTRTTGVNLPRLSPAELFKFPMPLPPLDEQRRIAGILDQADAIRTKRRASLALFDELKGATFQWMFHLNQPGLNFEWPLVLLGNELDFLTSGSRGWAKYYQDSGSNFIRIQNVGSGTLDMTDVAFVDPPRNKEAERTRVRAGDVLLSITADLGRTAVVTSEIGDAYINQHLSILRSSAVVPEFLSALLESPGGRRQLMKKNRGQTKAGLNFDDIRCIEFRKPPIELQREFAARVEQINAQRALVEQALAKDEELFASLQSRAFKGEL